MRATASAPLFDKSPIPGEPPWKDSVIRRRTPPFVSSVWPAAHALAAALVVWGLSLPMLDVEPAAWARFSVTLLATAACVSSLFARNRIEGVRPAHHRAAGAARGIRP